MIDALRVRDDVVVPASEFEWRYARAGGPGGQNVNKVNSRATLLWWPTRNRTLPDDARARLVASVRHRLSSEGQLAITSGESRDQERNRRICLERLRELILHALEPPIPRRPTAPTRASRARRLDDKRKRSRAKADRSWSGDD